MKELVIFWIEHKGVAEVLENYKEENITIADLKDYNR